MLDDGSTDGVVDHSQQIIGTYLHGLFDHPQAAAAILRWAGLDSEQAVAIGEIRERQLNRLADCIDTHMEPSFLQAWMG